GITTVAVSPADVVIGSGKVAVQAHLHECCQFSHEAPSSVSSSDHVEPVRGEASFRTRNFIQPSAGFSPRPNKMGVAFLPVCLSACLPARLSACLRACPAILTPPSEVSSRAVIPAS